MFEIDDWMDGNAYYFKPSIMTGEEVLVLWKMAERVRSKHGHGVVWFKKDRIVFAEFPFYYNLDLKLELMKFISKLEDRLDKVGYFNRQDNEDDMRQIHRVPYYDEQEH